MRDGEHEETVVTFGAPVARFHRKAEVDALSAADRRQREGELVEVPGLDGAVVRVSRVQDLPPDGPLLSDAPETAEALEQRGQVPRHGRDATADINRLYIPSFTDTRRAISQSAPAMSSADGRMALAGGRLSGDMKSPRASLYPSDRVCLNRLPSIPMR